MIYILLSQAYQRNGAKVLKSLKDFQNDLYFNGLKTGKKLLVYVENQEPFKIIDYQGHETLINQKTGCCLLACSYILGQSSEYIELLNMSTNRRLYKE